jgi:hypothetical protein
MPELPIPGYTQVLACAPRVWRDVTIVSMRGSASQTHCHDLPVARWCLTAQHDLPPMHSAHHGPPPAAALLSFHTAGRDRLSFGLSPFKKKTNINKTVPYTPAPCEPGSFQCDRKSNAKIMTVWYKTCRHHTNFHCWYDRHTLSLKSSLCGVNELCFGTKQVRLGVITFDECKHAPWSICPSLVRQHGMDGGVFSHTVHALVQLMWHHTVALQCCPPRWWGASSSQVYIQGVCESTLNSNLCTHGVPSKS